MGPALVKRFGACFGITNGDKWFHYCYTTEGHAQEVLETANYFLDQEVMRVNISYDYPAKLIGPVHSGEDPRIIAGLLATPGDTGDWERSNIPGTSEAPPKECKGKGAARALAVIILDERMSNYIALNDPKALQQALLSLEPFGWPDLDALKKKLGF